jgi:hypothetical protein
MKFMKDIDEQMGVKIFMLVGYEDEDGTVTKGKCVDSSSGSIIYLSLLPVRFETPAPVQKKFIGVFKNNGDDIWTKWDEHLGSLFNHDRTIIHCSILPM